MAAEPSDHLFLVFGCGWIARQVEELLKSQGEKVVVTDCRIESREGVMKTLEKIRPTRVINAAGYHGKPNADWCEDHKETVIRSNVMGAINVIDCCYLRGIHITHFGSACIYEANEQFPLDGPGFTELDPPNFGGSFYSHSKITSENAIRSYPNALILRLRNPIAGDLHERNFVTKILGYKRLVNIPNSGSILTNLLPGMVLMSKNKDIGLYNFTSPGAFSHNEVMGLFRDMIRPSLKWENFTLQEQSKVLKAPRSNAKLDATKLVNKLGEYGYEVLECHQAMREAFEKMIENGVK